MTAIGRGRPRTVMILVAALTILASLLALPIGSSQAATSNLVPNQSVERSAGSKPAYWLQIAAGANARTFRYLHGGAADGRRFVRTMMTARRSGYAGWGSG